MGGVVSGTSGSSGTATITTTAPTTTPTTNDDKSYDEPIFCDPFGENDKDDSLPESSNTAWETKIDLDLNPGTYF